MAKLAVGVCVVFSLFLLASARHLPSKEETTQQSLPAARFTVLSLRDKTPFRIRFPHRCRHHPRLRGPPRVVSYGNDMIPLDEVDQKRVSTFHGLPLKSDFEFLDHRFHPAAALESLDVDRIIPQSSWTSRSTARIQTAENEPKVERGQAGEAAPEGGFKKWLAEILNGN